MINIVIVMGRITADPELKTTQSGVNYVRFTVAVDRPYKSGDEKQTDFINCVAWRHTAEFVDKYFVKGQMIAVQGSLQTGSFTNKDGDKVSVVSVNVDAVSFAGSKGADGGTTGEEPKKTTRARQRGKGTIDIDPDISDDLPY